MARRFFVGGNFKMNGTHNSLLEIVQNLNQAKLDPNVEVVIAPPSLYIRSLRETLNKSIALSAQNVFDKPDGAFTGEISVSQLRDCGATWVILGHSERRTVLKESDEVVASKTRFAVDGGLEVIWCCGESLDERENDQTLSVIAKQLEALKSQLDGGSNWSKIVIAYEPIWAIGTGKVATANQAQDVHKNIRQWLAKHVGDTVAKETRILYGGSVNEKNCKELSQAEDIDGFLVGGASLKPAFVDIINCLN